MSRRISAPTRLRTRKLLIFATGVAVATGGTLVGPSPLRAQVATPPSAAYQPVTVHTSYFAPQQRWGERLEVAGDVNLDEGNRKNGGVCIPHPDRCVPDGVNDVWVGVPSFDRDSTPNRENEGRVFLVDGRNLVDPQGNKNKPTYLVELNHPEPQPNANFGFWIENPGDLDADGQSDLVVGADTQDVPIDPTKNTQICMPQPEQCRVNMGKIWAFSGKTHDVIWEAVNPRPQGSRLHNTRFGSRIGTAGDVNNNGVNDIIVGASNNDNPEAPGCSDDGVAEPGCRRGEGQAFIFEGANGTLIRELNMPPEDRNPPGECQSSCGSLGLAVQSPGDVDGDGTPDQLVDAGSYNVGANASQGRMYVYSGATGQVIRRIDNPAPQANAVFGFQEVSHKDPGDVNQDGFADIYGNGFTQAGKLGEFDAGRAWVFNGGAGTPAATPVLYELSGHPSETKVGAQCCWSMTRDRKRNPQPGQNNADDENPLTNPLLVGAAPHHMQGNPSQQGEQNTFNAATGTFVQHLRLGPPWEAEPGTGTFANLGPNLGWTSASPGDLNGDGFREFLGGAPWTDVCEVMLGATNKRRNMNQGIIITHRSSPSGDTSPVSADPGNRNPADNVCEEAGTSGDPGEPSS